MASEEMMPMSLVDYLNIQKKWTIKPDDRDILGDRWAVSLQKLFDQALARAEVLRPECNVWYGFQYIHCKLAGMECRMIAEPLCCAIAGHPITPDQWETIGRLLLAADEILAERSAPRDDRQLEFPEAPRTNKEKAQALGYRARKHDQN